MLWDWFGVAPGARTQGVQWRRYAGEDRGKVTDTVTSMRAILASEASVRILAKNVEVQADSDSKQVHKAMTATLSNHANAGKLFVPTKNTSCANGMHHLGRDGMSAIMRVLTMLMCTV